MTKRIQFFMNYFEMFRSLTIFNIKEIESTCSHTKINIEIRLSLHTSSRFLETHLQLLVSQQPTHE